MSEMSPTIGALAAALSKAQGAMAGAKKDNVNPHFKSKYADLASIWDAIRAPLSANGLSVVQLCELCDNGASVTTTMLHTSGEWVRGTLFVPASKQDAQGFGSALTYARRYSLAAITGIAPEDDDGQAATTTYKTLPIATEPVAVIHPADAAPLIAAIQGAILTAASPRALKKVAAQIEDGENHRLLTTAQATVLKGYFNDALTKMSKNGEATT